MQRQEYKRSSHVLILRFPDKLVICNCVGGKFLSTFLPAPPPPPSQALVQKNMLFCVFFVYLCRRGGNPVSSLIEPTFALESRHKNDSTLSAEWWIICTVSVYFVCIVHAQCAIATTFYIYTHSSSVVG